MCKNLGTIHKIKTPLLLQGCRGYVCLKLTTHKQYGVPEGVMSSTSLGAALATHPLTDQLSVDRNKNKTTVQLTADKNSTKDVNCKGYLCTPQQVDYLVNEAAGYGLVTARLRAWYCKAAFVLGSEVFMRCVGQARQGNQPAKLFSYLLRQELAKPLAR